MTLISNSVGHALCWGRADSFGKERTIIEYKENTCALRRGMNPTTLTHPTIDSTFGYSTVPNPNFYLRINYNLL